MATGISSKIKKIQDTFKKHGINLDLEVPRIAVVGDRNSGKSTIVDYFVGRDIVPRMDGIVTRRPLIVELINSPKEYGIFSHDHREFLDYEEMKEEIIKETEKLTGKENNVSFVPIKLQLYSPNVQDLTLIDLPPINRSSEASLNVTKEFLVQKPCIILAVTEASSKIVDCYGQKVAKAADPKGLRTIGVITKIDLIKTGADVRQVLENKFAPLRRGYVGVVNRSLADYIEKKSLAAGLAKEKDFFLNHPAYQDMAEKCGMPHLKALIEQIIISYISDTLRHFEVVSLQEDLLKIKTDLKEWNRFLPKPTRMLTIIETFQTDFVEAVERSITLEIDDKNIQSSAHAQIRNLINSTFPDKITKVMMTDQELLDFILNKFENSAADRNIFNEIVRMQILKFKEPTMKCIETLVAHFYSVVQVCTDKMNKYPYLKEEIETILSTYIQERAYKCEDKLCFLINAEHNHISINHEDFIGFSNDQSVGDGGQSAEDDARENLKNRAEKIIQAFRSYVRIVRKTFCDLGTKIIVYSILNNSKEFIKADLMRDLYSKGDETWFMIERKRCASSHSEIPLKKAKFSTKSSGTQTEATTAVVSTSSQTEATNAASEDLYQQPALIVQDSS